MIPHVSSYRWFFVGLFTVSKMCVLKCLFPLFYVLRNSLVKNFRYPTSPSVLYSESILPKYHLRRFRNSCPPEPIYPLIPARSLLLPYLFSRDLDLLHSSSVPGFLPGPCVIHELLRRVRDGPFEGWEVFHRDHFSQTCSQTFGGYVPWVKPKGNSRTKRSLTKCWSGGRRGFMTRFPSERRTDPRGGPFVFGLSEWRSQCSCHKCDPGSVPVKGVGGGWGPVEWG